MSDQVDVRSVGALEEFEEFLGRAQDRIQDFLTAATAQISNILDWVTEREHKARRDVSRAEARLESARDALDECQNSAYDDEEDFPDCSSWEDEVSFAETELSNAVDRLEHVTEIAMQTQAAAERFLSRARELRSVSDEQIRFACLFLKAKTQELRAYLSVTAPGSVVSPGPPAQRPSGTIGVAPPAAPGHVGETTTRFIERGIVAVRIDDIPTEELGFLSKDDFRKYPYEEMLSGVRRFDREVRPAVEAGHDRDYFRARDQEAGVDYQHGLQRLYEVFYGIEPIRVTKLKSGRYDVTNGRHRLFVAKQAGLQSLPMSVSEEATTA